MQRLARLRAQAHSEAMGYLYVDGHVRAYHGKRRLPKTHVARIRLSMPATVDHWVNDRHGDPLFVVTATETSSLARELPEVLQQARAAVGDDRRVTVVFDRGGWSPKLFAQMIEQGFDVLTYRKGKIPPVPLEDFEEHVAQVDGRTVRYQLAERPLSLLGGKLQLREVVRLCSDGKHQTSMVTSRQDLPAAEVAWRMFERWRQENFFKYMRQNYALDALCGYATEPGDAQRLVPNPAHKALDRELKVARAELRKLEQQLGAAASDNEESARPTMRGFKIANADIGRPLSAAQQRVAELTERRRQTPTRVTAQKAAGDDEVLRLDRQTKRLTDLIKMVAYQAETALLHLLRPHYARHEDEGRSFVASTLALKGDLEVQDGQLRLTLEPMASPNRTRALAAVCEQLNETETRYPGTALVMRYAVREPQGVTI
jgi:prepilin-type processing-associated H-X9-DG protein